MVQGPKQRPAIETASPGVQATPGVCGGLPCIAGTRIPVWVLERMRQLGASERQLLEMYPGLEPGDLESAWVFVDSHKEEIERQIKENEDF
jgi:uncharacterized protein (DUF433 family)